MEGKTKVGALECTFVSPYMTQPPLFFYMSSVWFKIFNDDMQSFRRFSVFCSIISMFLIFIIGSKLGGNITGLTALAIFSCHPLIVFFSRISLPYHLYSTFALLVCLLMLKYIEIRNSNDLGNLNRISSFSKLIKSEKTYLLAAAVISAFSIITVYYSWVFFVLIAAVIIIRKRYKHLLTIVLIPLPLIVFLLVSYLSAKPGFTADFSALLRANKGGGIAKTFWHYREFLSMGNLFILGTIGLFCLRGLAGRWLVILQFFLMLHVVLMKDDTMISFISYPVIPVLPFLSLGAAAFIAIFLRELNKNTIEHLRISKIYRDILFYSAALVVLMLVFIPPVKKSFASLSEGFKSTLDFGIVKNPTDAFSAADFINKNNKYGKTVISTSNIWWLLDTRQNTDIFQSLAYEGVMWDFYLYDIPKTRFFFNPSTDEAKYLVEDTFSDLRSGKVPGYPPNPIKDRLTIIENNWRLLKTFGDYRIYLNPKFESEIVEESGS